MKAVLLSVALLFSVAAFAMDNTDATFTTGTEDVTGGAYDATIGAQTGVGATMDATAGRYGTQSQSLMGRGGAGIFRNQLNRANQGARDFTTMNNTQMGTQNDLLDTDATGY